jgi:hypothetical protein
MELKSERWNRKINMNDRYARHIQNQTQRERQPRNVPFIVKVVTVATGTEGPFISD